ncbi:hypothetical protein ABL78_5714 [Leptomonas seymouri]|uniref:AB hydrolase-1 domain-containing protein n=1 Tax=Leptomonas seymouri TaxID=5684 RepID=A0A0N1I361_LEPSE|nr:hypothetical protein ABL78_5714 [Leptomonas seymouri]|eukprot:KPI85231.1 hypothetical protein ABL78_5714 [Leptomonas seymouri]
MSASLFACVRPLSLLASALLVCILLNAPAPVLAGKDDLPAPVWDTACKSPFKMCSNIETYRYWGEKPQERLHFAIDALMNDPNNKGVLTVWLLMDDPDVEFAKELARSDLNVVVVYPRGTKQSTTYYTCAGAKTLHSDECWISKECAEDLSARSTEDSLFNASHFSADQVAHDLNWLILTLGDGRQNVVLVQGLSSVFALRLLQLHPQIPVGVIAMDYVHPLFFDTYGYLGGVGQDLALQHLLALCDDEVRCVGRLGAMEGSWTRLQTLMTLAKNNKLTCAKRLKWDGNKLWGSSFAEQLRSVLSLMLRYPAYPFLASNTELMSLIPSMLYRLQRCSDTDVKALDTLYTYITGMKGFTCPVDVYVQTHWLVNEFIQTPPPNKIAKYWSAEGSRRTLLPAESNINAFHTAAEKFPAVPRTAASKVLPVNATQRVLFISADVDPMSPCGASAQAVLAFHQFDNSVKALELRGIANQPAAVLTPCIVNNLRFYKAHAEWAEPDQCTLDASKKLDFLNGPTKEYYGVSDAWDYDMPNSDDGSSRENGNGDGITAKHVFRTLLILIVLAALGTGAYYAYNYVKDRGIVFHRVSDNFYENLHN